MLPVLFLSGVFGLIVGSFFTVVVSRTGTGETILWGRSRCDHCGKTLTFVELLPVLSFIAQGGQCRSCGVKIARVHPAIEVTTAMLFILLGWTILVGQIPPPPFLSEPLGFFPSIPTAGALSLAAVVFLYYAFVVGTAVAVSFYDFLHRMIPASFIWPLAALGLIAHIIGAFTSGAFAHLAAAIGVSVGVFALFWSLWFFSNGRAMGRGDADVALALALAFGPSVALVGLLFAFWIGAGVGLVSILISRLTWKSEIPFAPFLFGGALLSLFAAPYLTFFVPLLQW